MKIRSPALCIGLFMAGIVGFGAITGPAAKTVRQARPVVSKEASEALLRMGQTLRAKQFSFQAHTIRVYADPHGEFLHIFHVIKAVVRRPDRLLAVASGDDGTNKVVFDGKTAYVYSAEHSKYADIAVPAGTIEGMLKEAVGRLGVDFPLADFLSSAPNKAFLTGVTAGQVINTVTIDGAPYLHLFFKQPPGIELELWLSKNEQSLPRRLIVTYLNLPGQPNFIAEFSDWNFDIHPSDEEFAFQPPAGVVKVALKPVRASAPAKRKGAMR